MFLTFVQWLRVQQSAAHSEETQSQFKLIAALLEVTVACWDTISKVQIL